MTEKRHSFWDSIFGNSDPNERERKVLEYIVHRIGQGAHLGDVTQEEYVRRNATPGEVGEILENPRLIHAAHEQLREDFASGGELDPKTRPGHAGG